MKSWSIYSMICFCSLNLLGAVGIQVQAQVRSPDHAGRPVLVQVPGETAVQPQGQSLQFRKLTSNQGLSHNTVYAIAQDAKGQMWFATREGLNRYDSYQIKNYYIKDTLAGASADKIAAMLCDQTKIYLATEDGLFIYHQMTDQITRSEALKDRVNVLCLFKMTGILYVGTSVGLYKITGQKSQLISPENIPVRAIGQLAPNKLLISTNNQLAVIDTNGTFRKIFDPSLLPGLATGNFDVYNIYRDGKDRTWLCTNHGLFYLDSTQQRFIKLKFAPTDTKEDNTVRAITSSGKDQLYIGTEHGLYIYHPGTGKTEHYGQSFDNNAKMLNDKAIYSAFNATDGSVWLGTYFGGVNYIAANTYAFERITPQDNGQGLSGKAVSQMMEDGDHNIWIGTEDGGITIYNPQKGTHAYINKNTRPFYLNINNVHAIESDSVGNIWVGTFLGGLHKFDYKKQTTTVYTHQPGDPHSLSSDNVYSIYRDSRGTLWVGSQNGLDTYNYKQNNFSPFRKDQFQNKFIYDITEDPAGNLWFCTRFDGIYRYSASSGAIHHYSADGPHPVLPSNQIISQYKDSKNHIWFGTLGGGVCVLDLEKGTFKNFTTTQGLPNNNVYGILEDAAGFIWLTTNRGLSKYDPQTGRFINYNNKYGLPSNQFNFKSYLKSADGTLYFGSINGLCYFRPEKISSKHPLVPLIFTDFQLFNKSILPSPNGILKKQIDYTSHITLPYSQNVFTINYAAMDYANPGSTHYAYFLKGFEDKWNYVGGKNSVTYTNLSPGEYTFYVMAVQADGAQQSIERTLQIRITPPLYRTKLAYVFYIVLLLLLIWLYTRLIKFLHQQKTEVQIERIEKEKTKELSQNRLNFFTFISHEFKTPLTLILASIEKFLADKGTAFVKNTELSNIKNSASVLFKLIQQLMEFRKMETGHNSIALTYTDIIAFIRQTVHYFETVAQDKNTVLEFQTQTNTLPCYFDQDKLEKILFNLLSNAIKNTTGGKITVQIAIKTTEQDLHSAHSTAATNTHLEIHLNDTGVGMTSAALENIFNPFYTVNVHHNENTENANAEQNPIKSAIESNQNTPSNGTTTNANSFAADSGIGLALVGSLVGYLGGKITIDSIPDQGTQVYVSLPLLLKTNSSSQKNHKFKNNQTTKDGAIKDQVPGPPQPAKAPELHPLAKDKYTLLIVEDNKELLHFLSTHFATYYNIATASNGLVALKKIEKGQPDIIISDVHMPKMDGLELCKAIKNDPSLSYIPIILLSEWESQDIRVDGLHTGADAYMGKPFNLKELELLIANMIQSRVKLREHVISISELAIHNLPSNNKNQEFLANLSEILEKRFSDTSMTIEGMAAALHMSRTSLHLKLKNILNKSATELLNEYRLKRAAIMLENDMPISEVAYACGYNDPNYFSRVFKKQYGVTPAKFKEGAKKEQDKDFTK